MKWSILQKNIYDKVENTNSNLAIVSTAGSGKTTTALECLNRVPKSKKSIFLSFSNFIVSELKERVPSHVEASTLHSLGCRMVMDYYSGIKFHENKFFNLAMNSYKKKEFSKEIYRKCYNIQEISNYLRLTLTPLTFEDTIEMCSHFGIDWEEENIDKAIELIERDYKPKQLDFTDMIYIPAMNPQIVNQVFDCVFIDEAQDTNACQWKFLQEIKKINGRFISFGDYEQAIFGFMGAGIDSFQKICEYPNTIQLPLSVCYRCGKNIVSEARRISSQIQPFEGSIDGVVRSGEIDEITEGDMVLSRTNAPLISLYFYLIGKGVKSHIVGKEIEKGLVDLAKTVASPVRERIIAGLKKRLDKIEDDLTKLNMNKPRNHPRYKSMYDKVEIILLILDRIPRANDLIQKIEEIFDDKKEGTKLLTIHRSKGSENDRVFLIDSYNGEVLLPSRYATQEWEKIQERNLAFVSLTRAKKELVYLDYIEE
jgi:DNA helicase-2/ATP-dependent DNA helicase PcrA